MTELICGKARIWTQGVWQQSWSFPTKPPHLSGGVKFPWGTAWTGILTTFLKKDILFILLVGFCFCFLEGEVIRLIYLVTLMEVPGIEPMTLWVLSMCSDYWAIYPSPQSLNTFFTAAHFLHGTFCPGPATLSSQPILGGHSLPKIWKKCTQNNIPLTSVQWGCKNIQGSVAQTWGMGLPSHLQHQLAGCPWSSHVTPPPLDCPSAERGIGLLWGWHELLCVTCSAHCLAQ